MSPTLTSGFRVGYESPTDKNLNPMTFAYKIQIRHTLMPGNHLSIVNKKRLNRYQSIRSGYTQRLK
jgi:hypothetical protein